MPQLTAPEAAAQENQRVMGILTCQEAKGREPVSYTHLDVYKRQVIKPSNPFTNVCWVSVLTTFSAPPQIFAASTVFFCPIPEMCIRGSFWSGNVLSPAKLHDKWTQLEINRNKQQAGVTACKPKLDLTNTDWIYGVDL